jgi:hypothetical protein
MDARGGGRQNPAMGRYTFPAFKISSAPRYIVVWGLQWQLIDRKQLEPGTDLSAAMTAAIERLHANAWKPEGTAEYGFVFIRRDEDRRLLMLTPRDPYSATSQSFSPFK